ncbi:VOC family protein [Priestia megaterium]
MIKGLYESHLPVSNIEESIVFYESLGLKLYKRYDSIAFFWIVENQSWLGLWEGEEYQTKYHPSLRHIAFYIDIDDLEQSIEWLQSKGISPKKSFDMEPLEPIVLPDQAHAVVYFDDPDKNSLELISRLPIELERNDKMYLSEWKAIIKEL